ncbi:MAG: peptidase [Ferruginibacter sp.]|nr:peptidase [Ferruginibacter sp.]
MQITALILLFIIIGWIFWYTKKKPQGTISFPESFRTILLKHVHFYNLLTDADKSAFEKRMLQFLDHVKITGIGVMVKEEDKVFIAASALIPIFFFDNWEYNNLNEVLLYPDSFSEEFELQKDKERPVLGMVGNGPMQHVMILSQAALREGFLKESGTQNTAIHEFVHLIDKTDGDINGIPENILSRQYIIPWINRMHEEIREIREGNSDINPYGATNQGEFFAVVSEYFFEKPAELNSKHPELYKILQKIFNNDNGKPFVER